MFKKWFGRSSSKSSKTNNLHSNGAKHLSGNLDERQQYSSHSNKKGVHPRVAVIDLDPEVNYHSHQITNHHKPPLPVGGVSNSSSSHLVKQISSNQTRSSREDSSGINFKRRELPTKFAQCIIECEILVDRPDATAEHVQKLMDLYTVTQS